MNFISLSKFSFISLTPDSRASSSNASWISRPRPLSACEALAIARLFIGGVLVVGKQKLQIILMREFRCLKKSARTRIPMTFERFHQLSGLRGNIHFCACRGRWLHQKRKHDAGDFIGLCFDFFLLGHPFVV